MSTATEDLKNYKYQLQQVEAALTTSPEDAELLKLKTDLEEVISLTLELIKAEQPEAAKSIDLEELGEASTTQITDKVWKAGDRCLALWLDDGTYHEAKIESADGDDISIIFDKFNNSTSMVITKNFLKELPKGHLKAKKISSKEREYQKKKKLKKQMRFKQLEEERESEKSKWLNFSSKTYKKGITKKSIFASPDNVNGRVGIGTCGLSGKGMTDFQQAEKYKK